MIEQGKLKFGLKSAK
ncbi:hypothetical protein F383_20795 [Gossypium arboreum]|uniref:Uncharacterized protein n=1 Tax=Gossypium arboreum TaxID=29729 RepID=A0A0B0NYJ8_GOSAR|nr:hypothetical protein F383_20795 [Gossypium arboreum]